MLSFSSGKKGSEPEYEVRRAAHSCRQDWGEKTVGDVLILGDFATTLGGFCSEPLRCGSGECGFSYVGLGVCHHYHLWPVKFALCIASHFMQLLVNPIVENACKKKKGSLPVLFQVWDVPFMGKIFNRCVDVEFLFLCSLWFMVIAVWEAQLWSWQDETEISGSSQPSWQGNIWFETRKKRKKPRYRSLTCLFLFLIFPCRHR